MTQRQAIIVAVTFALALAGVITLSDKPPTRGDQPHDFRKGNPYMSVPDGCAQAWEGQCVVAGKGDKLALPGPRAVRVIPITPPTYAQKLDAIQRTERGPPHEPFTQHSDDDKLPEGVTTDWPFGRHDLPAPPAKAEDPPQRRTWHWSDRDVCTRHGMHKVYTHGGRSWRCK